MIDLKSTLVYKQAISVFAVSIGMLFFFVILPYYQAPFLLVEAKIGIIEIALYLSLLYHFLWSNM